MRAYFEIDGEKSSDKGIRLMLLEMPVTTGVHIPFERLTGHLRAAEGLPEYEEMPIRMHLGFEGDGKAGVQIVFNAVKKWLCGAKFIRFWHRPDVFYEGRFSSFGTIKMLTKRHGEIVAEFACNPPCSQRAIGVTEWVPLKGKPLTEQITTSVKTTRKAFDAPGTMPIVINNGVHEPALFLKISGEFETLKLGSMFQINELPNTGVVFVDCDFKQCYALRDGKRQNVKHCGNYPTLNENGKLEVGGTFTNVDVTLLAIERS